MYEDRSELLSEIAALEDTYLEFKEVVFKGNQVRFADEEGRAAKVIAEVFMSMANTEGGVILFGVNKFGKIKGIDEDKRDLLEQFVVNSGCPATSRSSVTRCWIFFQARSFSTKRRNLHYYLDVIEFFVNQQVGRGRCPKTKRTSRFAMKRSIESYSRLLKR